MSDPVRIVQVGLGPWGRNWAKNAVPDVARALPVAWVDASADARAQAIAELGLPPERCFAALDDVTVEADAVLGTVALAAHVPVIEAALHLKKHVLIEKPFAPTSAEAARLATLAAESGQVLHVSHNYRFYPAVAKTRDLIAGGRFGSVIAVDIGFHRYAPDQRAPYVDLPDPLLGDMLIHQFDLIRSILGDEPTEVVCWSWNPPGSPFKYDASAVAMIRLAGGAVVSLRGSWLSREAPTPWAGVWRIQCEGGVVGFASRDDGDTSLANDRVTLRPLGGEEAAVPLEAMPRYGRAGTLDAFARAVRGQPTPGWEATAAHNVGSLRLMEAAIASAANGGAVTRVAEG